MSAILVLLEQVLAIIGTVASTLSTVLGIVGTAAQETQKFAIERIAAASANTVNSPTFGNAALLTAINAVNSQQIADTASIILAITDLTDGTTPVSLPTTPPAGYGGGTALETANAVWTSYVGSDLVTPWEYLKSLGSRSEFEKGYSDVFKADDLFSFFFPKYDQFGAVNGGQPSFDWGAINPANTFLEEITAQNALFDTAWYDGVGGSVALHDPLGTSGLDYLTNITGLEYDVITGRSSPVTTLPIPPVWPGIANVTLGTPVAIASQLTVIGPMDGVIVTITGLTTNKPALNYDTQLAYKFIGALAFVDDNGDVEPFQALAFTNALYCPKEMTLAASVVLRVDAGVAGTVTPWVAI